VGLPAVIKTLAGESMINEMVLAGVSNIYGAIGGYVRPAAQVRGIEEAPPTGPFDGLRTGAGLTGGVGGIWLWRGGEKIEYRIQNTEFRMSNDEVRSFEFATLRSG